MVHTMTLGEERYLVNKHAADYEHYRQKVPRYLGL
jgi:protein-S-isoprenylcysteine O-methyltransferase Ste14